MKVHITCGHSRLIVVVIPEEVKQSAGKFGKKTMLQDFKLNIQILVTKNSQFVRRGDS